MSVYFSKSGQQYVTFPAPLRFGGEGSIYSITNKTNLVLKIYHPDSNLQELERKIELMTSNQPVQSNYNQIAWPVDMVYSSTGFVGFAMPYFSLNMGLHLVYRDNLNGYPISVHHKITIAQNICAVIDAVHRAGYVVGDLNPFNIGVDTISCSVTFFDTDSYHIYDKATNITHRCNVCAPGYVAPELIHHMRAHPGSDYGTVPLPTFTRETDNFALAIHMFKLLMNGFTPFNGILETHSHISAQSPGMDDEDISTQSPGMDDEAVFRDSYCFKPGLVPLDVEVPSLKEIPLHVAELFQRAFIDGASDPQKRPSAAEYNSALESYKNQLKQCKRNAAHQYLDGLTACPWCAADLRYKRWIEGLSQSHIPTSPPEIAGSDTSDFWY